MGNASMTFIPGMTSSKGAPQKASLPSNVFVPSQSTSDGSIGTLTINSGTIVAFVYVIAVFFIYT